MITSEMTSPTIRPPSITPMSAPDSRPVSASWTCAQIAVITPKSSAVPRDRPVLTTTSSTVIGRSPSPEAARLGPYPGTPP